MSVTVVSCVYGRRFDEFIPEWLAAVQALDPQPDAVIVATDVAPRPIPGVTKVMGFGLWTHPQAFLLQQAIQHAETEWVWIVDIDDLALPDGLAGLDGVAADVWQVGYVRDGKDYVPPALSGRTYLGEPGNPFTAGSMIRTKAFKAAGGFSDVAFQDWSLWRRLAKQGATFASSDRAHYVYRRHAATRSTLELTAARRGFHVEEMVACEH